ncbi:MAG: amidohydrolase [Candidatus Heimdallarchaeota archaeon]|nr:amidohydrolase [Candidatus Heimdallarchaeota archaeon]
MSSEYDIIIKNAQILTLNKEMRIIDKGYILVKNSKIIEIGSMIDLTKKLDTKEEIDAKDKLVIPGFVNSHNHFAMTLFRGIADDLSLKDWLTNYIWPLEGNLEKNDCYIGTMLAAIEMIQGGTTTACDMYFHETEVLEALEKIGFRGVLGHGMLDFENEEKRKNEVKETKNLINLVKNKAKLCSVIISPHAPNTCSVELLAEAKKLSEDYNLPLQIHLAETEKEVEEIKSKYNVTPTQHLQNLGFLCKELVAAHCIWMNQEDYKLLKQNGVKIAHNPTSNLKLGSGILDFNQIINHDILLALGTDGPSSNNNLSMIEELRLSCFIHKGVNRNPEILSAKEAVKMATNNGAKALGLQDDVGSLEKGKKADIIIIDKKTPNVYPPHNPYSMIAYAMNDANVNTTIINGKIIMQERKFSTIDVSKTLIDAKEAIIHLLDRANLEQFKDKIRFLK